MLATFSTAEQMAKLVKVFVTSAFTSGHILSTFVNRTICGKPRNLSNITEVNGHLLVIDSLRKPLSNNIVRVQWKKVNIKVYLDTVSFIDVKIPTKTEKDDKVPRWFYYIKCLKVSKSNVKCCSKCIAWSFNCNREPDSSKKHETILKGYVQWMEDLLWWKGFPVFQNEERTL